MVSYDKGFGVANNDGTHVYCRLQHLPKVREGDVLSLAVRVGHNAHRCVRRQQVRAKVPAQELAKYNQQLFKLDQTRQALKKKVRRQTDPNTLPAWAQ